MPCTRTLAPHPLGVLLHAGLVVAVAAGCCGTNGIEEYFARISAGDKVPKLVSSELAERAKRSFWESFRSGSHEKIPEVAAVLTAAYLENPSDPDIALLLAHSHLWALVERDRSADDPTVTDHAILADRYFEEARRLNPGDARIPGWLGAVKLALGRIHQDEKETLDGYFMLQNAACLWPEFNHFSAAYPMSNLAASDELYLEAVEHLWDNVDACFGVEGREVDRKNPAIDMTLETTEGSRRACWNSWIAPHNLEGFFLNMGDMVLKTGDADTATKLYGLARSSEDYRSWPYRDVLEERVASASERARSFREEQPGDHPEMMFASRYNCMACHQE